jgi:hypothetical protein
MTKILFFLNTAFDVSKVNNIPVERGGERVNQFVNGINKLFEYEFESNVTFILSDNTISDKSKIDNKILDVIPSNVNFNLKEDNKLGSKNKGAGVLVSWKRSYDEISNYDYVVHFEPRLLLNDFTFLNDFLGNPRTLITLGENGDHFNTGLFSFDVKDFLKILDNLNADNLVKSSQSIEYSIFNIVSRDNVKYDTINKMGVRWFDSEKQIHHNM